MSTLDDVRTLMDSSAAPRRHAVPVLAPDLVIQAGLDDQ
jgi:hypothetical protein